MRGTIIWLPIPLMSELIIASFVVFSSFFHNPQSGRLWPQRCADIRYPSAVFPEHSNLLFSTSAALDSFRRHDRLELSIMSFEPDLHTIMRRFLDVSKSRTFLGVFFLLSLSSLFTTGFLFPFFLKKIFYLSVGGTRYILHKHRQIVVLGCVG